MRSILCERPHVVVVNLVRCPGADGLRLVHPLSGSGVHVVVVTEDTDRARWGHVLALGARGVLPKTAPLSAVVTQRLDRARLEKLSVRESEVLSHLMLGRAVCEIARTSFVSEATVRTQVKAILAELEVPSQLAAVALARHSGWVTGDLARRDDASVGTPAPRLPSAS